MAVERGPTRDSLVVVFSGRELTALKASLDATPALRATYTHDCYAAAADILIDPEACLIADVATLKRDQVALLSMAQRLGVPVYAYGQAARPLPEIAGLPQITPESASATLAGALAEDTPAQPQAPAPESLEQAEQAETQRQEEEPPAAPPPPTNPADLLSPEEIAALLDGRI